MTNTDTGSRYYMQATTGRVHTSRNCSVARRSTRYLPGRITHLSDAEVEARIADPDSFLRGCKVCGTARFENYTPTTSSPDELELDVLEQAALPADAPGAWIRRAIAAERAERAERSER